MYVLLTLTIWRRMSGCHRKKYVLFLLLSQARFDALLSSTMQSCASATHLCAQHILRRSFTCSAPPCDNHPLAFVLCPTVSFCGSTGQVLRERVRAGPYLPLGQGTQLHNIPYSGEVVKLLTASLPRQGCSI